MGSQLKLLQTLLGEIGQEEKVRSKLGGEVKPRYGYQVTLRGENVHRKTQQVFTGQ